MIKIEPVGESYKNGFLVTGHAEYAERGKDIVCASVSTLVQAIARELEKHNLGRFESESGMLICTIWADDGEYASKLTGMMLDTLRLFEKEFPSNIEVIRA